MEGSSFGKYFVEKPSAGTKNRLTSTKAKISGWFSLIIFIKN